MEENHFTIIIDACNHEKWIEQCLNTALNQKYKNYEVILVDAKSTDKTFEIAKRYSEEYSSLKIFQNETRVPQIANMLWLTKLSKPNTICVSLDGDDYLNGGKVLNKLNNIYNSGDVWMTYGTYCEFPYRSVSHIYHAYPDSVIASNGFREHQWLGSHLRTYRRELFLLIDEKDFKFSDGRWLDTAGDLAFQFPMLEMSAEKSRYISEILYIYNVANQNSDGNTNAPRQREVEAVVRAKVKYQRIEKLY